MYDNLTIVVDSMLTAAMSISMAAQSGRQCLINMNFDCRGSQWWFVFSCNVDWTVSFLLSAILNITAAIETYIIDLKSNAKGIPMQDNICRGAYFQVRFRRLEV